MTVLKTVTETFASSDTSFNVDRIANGQVINISGQRHNGDYLNRTFFVESADEVAEIVKLLLSLPTEVEQDW